MKNFLNARFALVCGMIALAAASRFLPHSPNFSPIMAMALFAGAYLSNKKLAYAIPLIAMFVTDIFLGFHSAMPAVYLSMGLSAFLGVKYLNKVNAFRVIGTSFAGALIFFVLTNLAVWMTSGMYAINLSGLVNCYAMAIPFFRDTLASNLICSGMFFGAFALAERFVPALAEARN